LYYDGECIAQTKKRIQAVYGETCDSFDMFLDGATWMRWGSGFSSSLSFNNFKNWCVTSNMIPLW
jgi:hypothetical protein